MKKIGEEIRRAIEESIGELSKISEEAARKKKMPKSWSKKEIIGHLIDSAANNHHRIVRAAYNAAADFPPYDQNKWVEIQQYQEMPWADLIELFACYNHQLSRVVASFPSEALGNPVNIGKAEKVTVQFVITDYLRHLKHHLVRVLQ